MRLSQDNIGLWKECAKRLRLSPAELCAACLLHGKLFFLSMKAACTFAASMQCEIEVLIAAPLSDEMPLRTRSEAGRHLLCQPLAQPALVSAGFQNQALGSYFCVGVVQRPYAALAKELKVDTD